MVGLNGAALLRRGRVAAVRLPRGRRAEGLHQRDVRRRQPSPAPTHGRYNVLLLGGDSGADRWGLRPDSLTVASIDAETGQDGAVRPAAQHDSNFPFAKGSVMAEQFPDGYDCATCELNSLATWAADHKSLFKGYAEPRASRPPTRASRASPA